MQSHHVDYFLGAGMAGPPRPNIAYAGGGSAAVTAAASVRPAGTRR
ncbi:hypothetical protein O3Q52_05875 [Streptomyces sp. ActVer]|nr:hypothetical protein [Streptomyces sp. ActVer]MCZ4507744.1 hypothetical protein [Streptomyces sp. ActVer]